MDGDDQPPPPVNAPATTLLHRALKLQPLKQGGLDGLCGLYAGINALRLLLAADRPLTPAKVRVLFKDGIRLLIKREKLAAAVFNGIPDGTWHRLLAKLVARASTSTGVLIAMDRPFEHRDRVSRRDLFKAVEAAVDARQPVLVSLSGKHQHYTVICGYTAGRLIQFDSGSLSWLSRKLCGPTKSRQDWQHEIDTASLTILELQSPSEL